MVNNNKHPKWSAEWEQKIKHFGKEIDKVFKKDEVKPDGTTVTTDTETVKVNNFELLLSERKTLKKQKEDKLEEITEKRGYKDEAKRIYKTYRELKEQVEEWKTNNYATKYTAFLGTNSSGTKYRTNGWLKLVKDYNQKTWDNSSASSASGANATPWTNLYHSNIWDEENRKWLGGIDITEPEVLKLVTQTLKVLGQIDDTKFNAALTDTSITAPTFTGDLAGKSVADVKNWLATAKKHAKTLIEKKHEYRTEYSLGNDYLKSDGNFKNDEFTQTDLADLRNLLKFLNQGWTYQDKVKESLTLIPEESEIVVRPAEKGSDGQPKPFTEGQLHDWGAEGYTDDSFANSKKTTSFYGTDPNWDNAIKVKIKNGLFGWTRLMIEFFAKHNQVDHWAKFISSFKNTPYRRFYEDISSLDEFGAFQQGGTGTHDYTYLNFPEYLEEAEDRLVELETDKDAIQTEIKDGRKELLQSEKEYEELRKAFQAKEKAIDDQITEKITELRTELATKFKVSDTQAPNFGTGTDANDQNRLTAKEHHELQSLIKSIRFLVSGDYGKPTGKANEDQALNISEEKVKDAYLKWVGWESIGWDTTKTSEENNKLTTADRIRIIKEKDEFDNLNYWHDCLVEVEKIVKLDSREQDIKKQLKSAIDNQTPEENLNDWRNNLKAIEAGLETAFADAKITQWKEKKDGKEAFNNVASINTLLKKVCVLKTDGTIEKVDESFIAEIKKIKKADGTDAGIDTLSKLITEKDPVEVIKIIHQWEFNKLDDTKKKERWLKFAWSDLGGKQKIDSKDSLTDAEKTKFEDEYLYQCAIGKINESSLTKPTEEQDDNNGPGQQNPTKEPKKPFWKSGLGITVIVLASLVVVAGVCCAIWWDSLKKWWGGTEDSEIGSEE